MSLEVWLYVKKLLGTHDHFIMVPYFDLLLGFIQWDNLGVGN